MYNAKNIKVIPQKYAWYYSLFCTQLHGAERAIAAVSWLSSRACCLAATWFWTSRSSARTSTCSARRVSSRGRWRTARTASAAPCVAASRRRTKPTPTCDANCGTRSFDARRTSASSRSVWVEGQFVFMIRISSRSMRVWGQYEF